MKWTWAAVALLTVARAWAQDTAVAPGAVGAGPADRPDENIALGVTYTIDPGPNYGLCSDPGDLEQLTDGVYTDGYSLDSRVDCGLAGEDLFDFYAGPGRGTADPGRLVQHGGRLCGR